MKASDFLTEEQKKMVISAIESAEKNTSGEIRVHIEKNCKGDVLDRTASLFAMLKMHKTEQRNGVLFYLAIEDRKFAILGDAGINSKVPSDFWNQIKEAMLQRFKENKFSEGIAQGISMAGLKLKEFFPLKANDVNELSNDISFGN